MDSITAEVDEVNSFGDGAADEWRKGMTQRGKDAMADSSPVGAMGRINAARQSARRGAQGV